MTRDEDSRAGGLEKGHAWGHIGQCTDQVCSLVSGEALFTPEQVRAILEERAKALAGSQRAPEDTETLEIIKFNLAFETYGIETSFVREVCHLKSFTPLPGVPSFVLGILNLRGEIVSVVDLKKFFNLPAKGLGELNKVIILRGSAMEFGILADSVVGVRSISISKLNPPPPTVQGIGADCIKGVTAKGLIVLDARRLLEDERMTVSQEVE